MNIGMLIKTKTFWVGVITVLYGISELSQGRQEVGIQSIMLGLAMVTGREAILKVGQ